MADKVVTRFAPSPTGFMHVGSIRTAMYAWLFARKHNGTFILRIEDTDKAREVAGSTPHIIESLTWLGLTWDEGPYLQSKRLDSYRRYAELLIEKGCAYPDPYTEEELETLRAQAEQEKRPFLFREHRPTQPEVWDGKKPLRFRVPIVKRYEWHDIVRGVLSAGEEALDDFILIKGDGYPTYNFAHIVDDLEMGVTHVMRGEEFISSTPKFLSLYDALGIEHPHFATLPVILGPDGKKKLSKRDGAKDVLDYRAEGYLPEAFVNFLALLGWHPQDNREVFTLAELTAAFELPRLQKAGAKFDEDKLAWLNHEHLKRLSDQEFTLRFTQFLEANGEKAPDYLLDIVPLIKDRAQTFGEAAELIRLGEFAYMQGVTPDPLLLVQGAKANASTVKTHLGNVQKLLQEISDESFTVENIKNTVFPYAEKEGRAAVLWPLRVALSGQEKSPDPFTLAALLGKQITLERIAGALAAL